MGFASIWKRWSKKDRREENMVIIAGLGNPDKKYQNTRHNAGFDAIDCLADRYSVSVSTKKHRALVGKGVIGGVPVLLMKPQTYMNLSGESVRDAADYYNVPPEKIIVLCDDVNLDLGVLRIRKSGSAGGHNGLKNIIQTLGSQDFQRIRIGVGKQPPEMDLISFVLSHFTREEREEMDNACRRAAEAAVIMITDGTDEAMNRCNGKRTE